MTSPANTTLRQLPGVLSFQRGQICSDGVFYNRSGGETGSAIPVIRHGIRGTQNVVSGDEEVSQIQTTETAKTDSGSDGFAIEFSYRPLPFEDCLCALASKDDSLAASIETQIDQFIEKAKCSAGMTEVANRIARNIANARWVWRNRSLATSLTIEVKASNGSEEALLSFDAFKIPLNNFDAYTDQEKILGEMIASNFNHLNNWCFTVKALIDLGFKGAVEVFPSQNYAAGKPKGFARPLYKLGKPDPIIYSDDRKIREFQDTRRMGDAGLRSDKIMNALRTIDTWYPEFSTVMRPIAIEPNGASQDLQRFLRPNTNRDATAFKLILRIGLIDPNTPAGMFIIGALLRGGVYSESEKESTAKEKPAKSKK